VVLRVAELASRQQSIFLEHVEPELRSHGIGLCSWADLTEAERTFARDYYDQRIFPVLTPLAVDPAHPFPYVSNLALSLAVMVRDPKTGDERFARVKVPTVFPRLLALPGGDRFVPVDVIIETHIGALFPGMEIADAVAFRVTRNTDLTLEDEDADDLLAAVETELRRRRFGRAVRLEVEENASPAVVDLLLDELELHRDDVTWVRGPLDLTCLWQVHALDRPELKDDPWVPVTAGRLAAAENDERSIFSVVRERALLVHHPYESFASSVEEFLSQAADDPRVQSIKMTLYRTSGDRATSHPRRRAWRAGGGSRGVEGALRRSRERHLGQGVRARWRSRGLWAGGFEDARQVRDGRSRGCRWLASLRSPRNRQLQLANLASVRRPRLHHVRTRHHG
jgi:polyphosphate kinase